MWLILVGIKFLFNFILSLLDNLTANKKTQITKHLGLQNLQRDKPLLFYVHYSKNGDVSPREIETLQNAKKAGLQVCLVINVDKATRHVLNNQTDQSSSYFDSIIIRNNVGWDLGAYRDAYFLVKEKTKITNNSFFFLNNSVIWFPEMIEKYFAKLLSVESDIVAGSISSQYRKHLQTFLFGAQTNDGVIVIENWLSTIKNWRMKRSIVRLGELGTSTFFNHPISIKGLPESNELIEVSVRKIHDNFKQIENENVNIDNKTLALVMNRLNRNRKFSMAGIPLNPSHDNWLELLESGFPGIKVDLVRSNPGDIPDYEVVIAKLVESGFTYSQIGQLINSNKPRSLIMKIRIFLKY
jgi:hypothetical protein